MPLDIIGCRQQLKLFNLQPLFVEQLGWDRHSQRLDVTLDGQTFTLAALGHKRGMVAFLHEGELPDYPTRRKIERQVAKNVHEHLLIFTDPKHTTQIWQWVKREPGKPLACREHTLHRDQPGDALIQKLQVLAFNIEEEESLTIVDVTSRVRAGFDVERVTKRFYDRFKTEHAAFLTFIKGIPDDELHRWYASVMLNRLMFVYFIQKKTFLNNDPDYLRNKLTQTRRDGRNRFYAELLCPLFFEGFAKKAQNRSAATNQLLGKVPYLNGGIFQRHQIEELHGDKIQVADAAFDRLFDFFDQYRWHLDERPLRQDNEINPDVLGYIFEKYINQKQMGAYYTKEDITGYNSAYTILPFLFEVARAKCKVAFEGENSVWKLLQADPDRYIYPAVKKGVELKLPAEIAAGIKDVSKRTEWNKPAPAEYALPTEIWREVVARRQRYEEIRKKLADGAITDINDFITYNLDIRQFAQDVIENAEPDLLSAFYAALLVLTVLDPTCGSGAFLFAALNVLYPLYEACLNRMALFVAEWERTGSKAHPNYAKNFKTELSRLAAHHNEPYFILKSIIVNNLYGVDIMDEAVEICKLRLFLKLVAQVESADDVEPLPDIDFNIRAGNTLVGFATEAEAERAIKADLLAYKTVWPVIQTKAADLQQYFDTFRSKQMEGDGSVPAEHKKEVRKRLEALETELNRYLATDYGVDPAKPSGFDKWLRSYKPFHWFIEFYGIMKRGGFDILIGNPPWVEFGKVKDDYVPKGLRTLDCNNLWAFIVERSYHLLRNDGRIGFIVPMSLVCTERMLSVQDIVRTSGVAWVANFESDSNPGQLFDGVKQNVTILLAKRGGERGQFTTRLFRFFQEYRDYVFDCVEFTIVPDNRIGFGFPKIGSEMEAKILKKLFAKPKLAMQMSQTSSKPALVHRIAHYYIKCFDFTPYFRSDRDGLKKSEDYWEYLFSPPVEPFVAAINSATFYFYWQVFFDAFKAGRLCVESFPLGQPDNPAALKELVKLAKSLMRDLKANATRLRAEYKATGMVEYDQFYPRKSKPIMDEIDRVLGRHYGLTPEELDFIINYDIKYRLGRDAEEEGEE